MDKSISIPFWRINKKSIQWTPDIKFVSATLKKILVKNDFWTTKSKKFSWKKIFFNFFPRILVFHNSFSKKEKIPENFFAFVFQKSFLTKIFFDVAEINLTSRVHCILVWHEVSAPQGYKSDGARFLKKIFGGHKLGGGDF